MFSFDSLTKAGFAVLSVSAIEFKDSLTLRPDWR